MLFLRFFDFLYNFSLLHVLILIFPLFFLYDEIVINNLTPFIPLSFKGEREV